MSNFLLSIFMITVIVHGAFAQETQSSNFPESFFIDENPLEITLLLDLERLLNDTSYSSEYSPAILIEHDKNGNKIEYAVKVKTAGNTRLKENVCDFPPLRLNFKKSELENTTFAGLDKVKLITHCREDVDFNNYVTLEYLAYKSYMALTKYSFKVRLAKISYMDIAGKYDQITKFGFFVEDDQSMAERNGGEITDKKIWSPDSCKEEAVSLLTLFEFMIGNTDWWIHTRHNIVIVELENGELVPVPYDFDYSGLVEAPYAIPSKLLPIPDVRHRFLKGDCENLDFYWESINICLTKKDNILSLFNSGSFLDRRFQKPATHYIGDFYDIIEKPKEFEKYIAQSCKYFSDPESHLK